MEVLHRILALAIMIGGDYTNFFKLSVYDQNKHAGY